MTPRVSSRRLTHLLIAVAILSTLAIPDISSAGDGLDVQAWLDRPGTRLVVVEFYATWCKPCMKAVPRWKALHEKYRNRGLRLIVVNTQDPYGACSPVGWTPDDIVCDLEGHVYNHFKLERLPAAFLWSWQGNLLVSNGHVDEVEAEVKEYLKRNPRVLVEAKNAAGRPFRKLHDLLRHRLRDSGKLTVVATNRERRELRRIQKLSYEKPFDDKLQCELGQEVSANSLLKAAITGQRGWWRLSVSLFSAESACLLVGSSAPWNSKQPGMAVAEAVDGLLSKLKQGLQMPSGKRKPIVTKHDSAMKKLSVGERQETRVEVVLTGGGGEMVLVPAGAFWMGCNPEVDSECEDDEKPGRNVHLDAFQIDKTEVTVEQYGRCVQAGRCKKPRTSVGISANYYNWEKPGREKHPINGVDWSDAKSFCEWSGKRLPTEAEWEKAARGTDGWKYPWGHQEANCESTVMDDRSTRGSAGDKTDGCGEDRTWPVCSKEIGNSLYGLCDMAGNLWEWVLDRYKKDYYSGGPRRNPSGPVSGKERVLRGGSWYEEPSSARASNRYYLDPVLRDDRYEFRCARSAAR